MFKNNIKKKWVFPNGLRKSDWWATILKINQAVCQAVNARGLFNSPTTI